MNPISKCEYFMPVPQFPWICIYIKTKMCMLLQLAKKIGKTMNVKHWRLDRQKNRPFIARMFKNKWIDRITNEDALDRIREKRTLWKNLRKRRTWMIVLSSGIS